MTEYNPFLNLLWFQWRTNCSALSCHA